MLDTATKKRIDDCRDILVGKLPDPKSQIEQITIGLIYKFMDDMDKEAVEFGGQAKFFSNNFEKYNWDNLFDTKVTANEMFMLYSEAIESMEKNPNIPQLFRDIFKDAYLPYRDPETLKMFLKTIGEFEYTHSEKLGDAFEYLLSIMGSQGDAGQFRTPRHIIDFLVEAVNPSKTDKILDPACGTAGFLISAFKYIRDKVSDNLTPDDRKKIINNFIGYDISPDMVRLSLVNLYLHGFSDPHIFEYDTLSSEERWDENYDVILANPPFMSPKGGIRPHNRFSVKSNRSEVLFVDYIAEHLNTNGRAGIIVPEGVIFQSGTAYKDLRKMLVNKYLYAVVSLPAGVFNPYSGVKTSILLMDKVVAKKSSKVLFVKIDNDGYNLGAQRNEVKGGQLEEAIETLNIFKQCIENNTEFENITLAHAVEKFKIAETGDYNLGGERYREVLNVKYSNFDMKLLSELVEFKNGLWKGKKEPYVDCKIIRNTNFTKSGQIDLSDVITLPVEIKQLESRKLEFGDIILENSGGGPKQPVGRVVYFDLKNNDNYSWSNFTSRIRVTANEINSKYLFHILNEFYQEGKTEAFQKQTSGIRNLDKNDYSQIQIPLPPLSIQEEIVAEIEGYQKIIDGAKMVVDNYKPQIDIDPEWEMVELGAHCKIKGGNAFKSEDYVESGVQLIRMGNVKQMLFDIGNSPSYLPEEYLKTYPNYILEKGDLLISMTGTVGKEDYGNVCQIDIDDKFLLNQRVGKFEIFSQTLNYDFLYYLANSDNFRKQLFSNTSGGVRQANISNKGIESILIPLPSIETQRQIVFHIEKEQEAVNSAKQLIEIFEQKIKDRIAKVWGE